MPEQEIFACALARLETEHATAFLATEIRSAVAKQDIAQDRFSCTIRCRMRSETKARPPKNGVNVLKKEDAPVHDWYRFVLSFPPHLVRQYLNALGVSSADIVLDPFCGTGTTLVESKKHGISSVGCDAHPFAAMISRVKTTWDLDADLLRRRFKIILRRSNAESSRHGLEALSLDALMLQDAPLVNGYRLSEEEERLLPTGFLSQRPLQRLLVLRDGIERATEGDPISVREFFSRLWPTLQQMEPAILHSGRKSIEPSRSRTMTLLVILRSRRIS